MSDKQQTSLWFAYFLTWHDIGKFFNGLQQLFEHNNPNLIVKSTITVSNHDTT